jgi:hypothetical protein
MFKVNNIHQTELNTKYLYIIIIILQLFFLRKASLASLISALVSAFLVAKTFFFFAPLDFLIFIFNYF